MSSSASDSSLFTSIITGTSEGEDSSSQEDTNSPGEDSSSKEQPNEIPAPAQEQANGEEASEDVFVDIETISASADNEGAAAQVQDASSSSSSFSDTSYSSDTSSEELDEESNERATEDTRIESASSVIFGPTNTGNNGRNLGGSGEVTSQVQPKDVTSLEQPKEEISGEQSNKQAKEGKEMVSSSTKYLRSVFASISHPYFDECPLFSKRNIARVAAADEEEVREKEKKKMVDGQEEQECNKGK